MSKKIKEPKEKTYTFKVEVSVRVRAGSEEYAAILAEDAVLSGSNGAECSVLESILECVDD